MKHAKTLWFLLLAACSYLTAPTPQLRIVTFGDSNLDLGFVGRDSIWVAASYVSFMAHALSPTDPNNPHQLAGKIERLADVKAVNHAISGTTSGTGFRLEGFPNARGVVHGITRYEAEVLGLGRPWESGNRVQRVQAFTPTPNDFVLISIGTNDGHSGIPIEGTRDNLAWMIARWIEIGHAADHLILTTLPPFDRIPRDSTIHLRNAEIRQLAAQTGVGLIDLSAYLSRDDGRTWNDSRHQVGDGLHYSESVRDWLAEKVVQYIRSH